MTEHAALARRAPAIEREVCAECLRPVPPDGAVVNRPDGSIIAGYVCPRGHEAGWLTLRYEAVGVVAARPSLGGPRGG